MRTMVLLFVCALVLVGTGCHKKPGPISVQNVISPATVESGGYVNWEILVTNPGGKATISRIHCSETCIQGWAEGYYGGEADAPLSVTNVGPNATEVVYATTAECLNTGADDIVIQNTVTVYSDGGTATDVTTYTIVCAKTASGPAAAKGVLE